jgi:6-phosphogluconolactonase
MRHEIVVEEDPDAVALAGMRLIAARAEHAIAAKGRFEVAVSGGKTPWVMFSELGRLDLPWDKISIFQVDERIAGADDDERNLAHLRRTLGEPGSSAVVPMEVESADLEAAASRYAALLPERFDLVHLGIGSDGHTASLVPGDAVLGETEHLVWPTGGAYQGRRRMTLTYLALARADELLWLIAGAEKADALARLVKGDREIPAGRVEGPPRSTIIADRESAGQASP